MTAVYRQTWLRRLLSRLPRFEALGVVWYWLAPERGVAWGGPFNGQRARQALFKALVEAMRLQAIVETGTYLGTTTQLFAETGLPVFTVEADGVYRGFCRARFWRNRHIRLIGGDSRTALRGLLAGPLRAQREAPLFFYLDAHWNADLPLAEEVDIVFSQCPSATVMIDDFQVPGEPGYAYDDYGPGKALDLSYLAPAIAAHRLLAYFPSTPAAEETGARRGCVVLAQSAAHGVALDALPLLRKHAAAAPPAAAAR